MIKLDHVYNLVRGIGGCVMCGTKIDHWNENNSKKLPTSSVLSYRIPICMLYVRISKCIPPVTVPKYFLYVYAKRGTYFLGHSRSRLLAIRSLCIVFSGTTVTHKTMPLKTTRDVQKTWVENLRF